jgi:hypothetical protein
MPENVELIVRLHPTGGEDIAVWTRDFTGVGEAIDAIADAIDHRRNLTLRKVRYQGDLGQSAVVINLKNVVTVRVLESDASGDDASGQYL